MKEGISKEQVLHGQMEGQRNAPPPQVAFQEHLMAAEHYKKFLDVWNDADLSILEVEGASKRLARLKK